MNNIDFGRTFELRCRRSGSWPRVVTIVLGLMLCLGWAARQAAAQTAGDGTISGLVTDSTGAVIAKAKVTATNTATNIATVRTSTSAGYYTISPLPPGSYTLEVSAGGFNTYKQENLTLDALQVLTVNAVLNVGAETQTVTVTTAPPQLQTENATLGMVMENENYSSLPILMNQSQRDPTAFALLTPAAQSANNGGRMPIVGGTGSYLGQLYVDGMPAETVSQQGDNRLVSLTMDLDAVDQFQMVTSTPPAEYIGAGAENFTMKSGGIKYHGQISDFVRNTAFDAWGFTAPYNTVKNSQGVTVQAPKPVEHQNELSISAGGVVPFTAHKLFFYGAYTKFHYRTAKGPGLYTIPTTLMQNGDFTEIVQSAAFPTGNPGTGQTGTGANNAPIIYDPTNNSCNGVANTRCPFQAMKDNVLTNNVIPANKISPIAQYMQKFLPAPTNTASVTNNYLGSVPGGFDNHVINWRVDFDLSSKQRLSSEGLMGTQNYINNFSAPYIAGPYVGGDLAHVFPKDYVIGDTYTISPNLVNQLKGSFTRFFQNIQNDTQGVTAWEPAAIGMTNIPQGQAGQEFPGAAFTATTGYSTVQTGWTSNGSSISTQLTTPNNYAVTDNLEWLKGKHSLTFGFTYQWQEDNNANPATYSSVMDFTYNANSTANFSGTGISTGGAGYAGSATGPSGYPYASYLLGAIGNNSSNAAPSLALQPLSETGGRFKPAAPYVEDIYKLTRKLTLDVGLRWDYLPPFHEVKDRWTFLNPALTNPLTNTPGMLQFAGNWGGAGVSIGSKTPVQTYWKNWGPRVSLAYQITQKTVFRAGFAQVFSQGGGVGGRAGAANGTGGTGFNMTALATPEATTGASAGPSFYLNNSTGFATAGAGGTSIQNTSLFGPGFTYPAAPTPGLTAQELQTGFYLNTANNTIVTAGGVNYADPYISGRAPTIEMFNAGFERGLTQNMTLEVDYMGNESHFIINSGTNGANARGYWSNQLDPKYLAVLGNVSDSTNKLPLLNAPATAANVTILQQNMAGSPAPAFFTAAAAGAAKNSTATIAQMLVAFPQYSGVTDTWGVNVGNFSYHSLQVTLNQRFSQGLTFNASYTFSKNIGDDGSFRSGFNIPQAAISNGTRAWHQDRMDRSWTDVSIPHSIKAYGVYELPFGKGHIGSNSFIVRTLAGGWKFSSIYTFTSGLPVLVTWNGCSASTYPGQGQCMPDVNSAYSGPARINGKYGSGPDGYIGCNLGLAKVGQPGCKPIQYINVSSFSTPTTYAPASLAPKAYQYLIGNAPRSAPLHLRQPYTWDLDAGLHRTFPIHGDVAFEFQADATNVWNHVTFGGPSGAWASGSTTFGGITGVSSTPGPRDFQFAGHIKF
ncbi:MAG: TonB-dependent receptor [Terracidiphilus sp.]